MVLRRIIGCWGKSLVLGPHGRSGLQNRPASEARADCDRNTISLGNPGGIIRNSFLFSAFSKNIHVQPKPFKQLQSVREESCLPPWANGRKRRFSRPPGAARQRLPRRQIFCLHLDAARRRRRIHPHLPNNIPIPRIKPMSFLSFPMAPQVTTRAAALSASSLSVSLLNSLAKNLILSPSVDMLCTKLVSPLSTAQWSVGGSGRVAWVSAVSVVVL
jgi:hypothetical protein